MSRRKDTNLIEWLRRLADFRMLTLTQIALLSGKGSRAVRRWKEHLVKAGFVEALPESVPQGHGGTSSQL